MTVATVLVPTHEHGPLLTYAVSSALEQTVEAIEVFIVCDGPSEPTLEAAEVLAKRDHRVRLFVHDKGPRHGEVYRHQALQEAAGDIVCYLSDDDLWLPRHVASMAEVLASVDFAHSYPVGLDADGNLLLFPGHLSLDEVRAAMIEGRNFIPLSCAAHTLDLYRHLPHGWRTTPEGIPTDLYMWQQILDVEGVRSASGREATVLHFPSARRDDMTIEQRRDELARWSDATAAPGFDDDLHRRVRDALTLQLARNAPELRRRRRELDLAAGRISTLEAKLTAAGAGRDALAADLARAKSELGGLRDRSASQRAQIDRLEASVERLEGQLGWITRSRTWRIRGAVLSIPGVGRLVRRAGRTRVRREGP